MSRKSSLIRDRICEMSSVAIDAALAGKFADFVDSFLSTRPTESSKFPCQVIAIDDKEYGNELLL